MAVAIVSITMPHDRDANMDLCLISIALFYRSFLFILSESGKQGGNKEVVSRTGYPCDREFTKLISKWFQNDAKIIL